MTSVISEDVLQAELAGASRYHRQHVKWVRVENKLDAGTPDIWTTGLVSHVFCGWIELKVVKTIDETTSIFDQIKHFTEEQARFLEGVYASTGAFLMVHVGGKGGEAFLISPEGFRIPFRQCLDGGHAQTLGHDHLKRHILFRIIGGYY